MSMAFSRFAPNVTFERVASIVIFTNVTTNVVSNEEFTSRVLTYEFIYVKDEIIKKYKPLSINDAALKLVSRHHSIMWVEFLPFALIVLIYHLTAKDHYEEKYCLD